LNHLLIHLHVPKCAGTSINAVMRQHFGSRALGNKNDANIGRLEGMSREERDASIDIILGHWQWGVHEYFSRPALYFSVKRDPVARLCSFFNYIHRTPTHGLHSLFKARFRDINERDEQSLERLRRTWSNYFCYAYSGRRVRDEESFHEIAAHVVREMETGRLLVGDVDEIAGFLRSRGLLDGELPQMNVSRGRPTRGTFEPASPETLTPETRAAFEHWNAYDIRLLEAIDRWKADRATAPLDGATAAGV
jgi:hypothetical protein